MELYIYIYNKSQWRIRHNHELQTLYEGVDIVSHIRVRRPNWIGQVNWMDDTREVEQIFNSQPEGVGTKRMTTSRLWECVWSYMKKGRLTNWRQTYSNRNEWKKAIELV